tara:strand:- start:1459 stop:1872 length:414 start_codon:yes stop_codon:yes gene_type:complete
MGVLNKLKSRMSSYRGPTQVDPTMSSPVYGFDTGKKPSSGVDAVNAGLAAGSNQAPIQNNTAQDIANLGSTIGQAISTAYGKDKEDKKTKPKSNTPTGTFKESKPKTSKPKPKSGVGSKEEIRNLKKELDFLENLPQ